MTSETSLAPKIERNVSILEIIDLVGTIVVIEDAMFDLDVTGLQIEHRIDGVRGRPSMRWLRLVGGSVGIDDEVNLRLHDVEVAQQNARAPEIEDIDRDVKRRELGVGRFSLRFATVQDHSIGIGFEFEKAPMERADFCASAGCGFNARDQALADDVLEAAKNWPRSTTR